PARSPPASEQAPAVRGRWRLDRAGRRPAAGCRCYRRTAARQRPGCAGRWGWCSGGGGWHGPAAGGGRWGAGSDPGAGRGGGRGGAVDGRVLPQTYVTDGQVVEVSPVSGAVTAAAGDADSPLPMAPAAVSPPALAGLLAEHTFTFRLRARRGESAEAETYE